MHLNVIIPEYIVRFCCSPHKVRFSELYLNNIRGGWGVGGIEEGGGYGSYMCTNAKKTESEIKDEYGDLAVQLFLDGKLCSSEERGAQFETLVKIRILISQL